ncbi:DUF3148 domain-containing protein [Trichocoleus desertorum AS-A10]|uniref:regulatory protein SipA n=1 Tax=Trichocoleus desertorum TaxID=1481672 RepID=UPI003299B6CF
MSKEFAVGDRVRVVMMPPYVKTADPMPMLRPPNVIQLGEEGTILDRRPGGYWSIHFSGGKFLLDSQYLESADATAGNAEALEAEVIESSHTETLPPTTE